MRTLSILTILGLGVIGLGQQSSIASSDNQVQALYDLPVLTLKLPATNPSLQGDVNHDGVVNAADILALFQSWGACNTVAISANASASDDTVQSYSCDGDLNNDQVVGELDLVIVLKSWQ